MQRFRENLAVPGSHRLEASKSGTEPTFLHSALLSINALFSSGFSFLFFFLILLILLF